MITIEQIKKWSKPHPLSTVISLKDRQGGRMCRFGNDRYEFSIVGGASGLYGDFDKTFEVAIIFKKTGKFVTRVFLGDEDVIPYMDADELEKLVNSVIREEDLVVV